ncbi:hypothetical protein SODALDRAFT_376932 [Sodiomyces alkalinus F11]|uniref:Uncharacterized protein n=1 Tax=Sodiomyces alkalinus (strain CBS 110278 / VKM F-3762 / F11) TaxID=1314773 RepID=A0A3N2Q387_SODAK|nr:hypothetical protein SODALDRAFT_376932 [Sodiomyces alkalinus F11]ROT41234.1 hypothetical protein SODALDRAFT_376932 [Sodiomyces alkalinus F11]
MSHLDPSSSSSRPRYNLQTELGQPPAMSTSSVHFSPHKVVEARSTHQLLEAQSRTTCCRIVGKLLALGFVRQMALPSDNVSASHPILSNVVYLPSVAARKYLTVVCTEELCTTYPPANTKTPCLPLVRRRTVALSILTSIVSLHPAFFRIMAPRFPLDEAPGGSEAKEVIQEALSKMHGGASPFPWIDEEGNTLLGCYAGLRLTICHPRSHPPSASSYSYTPGVAKQFFEVAKSIYASGVKPRNRELAIIGLASVLRVPYVALCHRAVAPKVGLTPEQFEDGIAGKVPRDLSEEEALAYRLGRILTSLNGPLDEETWREVTEKMSKTEFIGIAHTVAGYRWVSLLEQVNADSRWD